MNAPSRRRPVHELAEYRSARRDAMAAEAMLTERSAECQRLTVELETARAEIAYLRGFLSLDAATSGPFHVWIAGYGDRRFIGYWHGDRMFIPGGMCVVEAVDVLHTEAIA